MRFVCLAFLLAFIPVHALSQQDAALQQQVQTATRSFNGKVGFYALDVRSGKTVELNADTPVPTASVIKLAILLNAVHQIQRGQASFGDRLQLRKGDQVEGSGVLQYFDTPLTLTFKDALSMMVIQSDNTATNLAIDHLGLANIDRDIQDAGLRQTWLYKKVFLPPQGPVPADQQHFGLGKTTPREITTIMRTFLECKDAVCNTALTMLKEQSDRDAIPRYLNPGLTVANKTGALDNVRNDVAIIYAAQGPIVMSAFTYENQDQRWSADNGAQLLIARLAKLVLDAWK